jgi:hypothetical protein
MYDSTTNLDDRRIIVGSEVLIAVVMGYNAVFSGLHGIIPEKILLFRRVINAYTSSGKHSNKTNYRTDS